MVKKNRAGHQYSNLEYNPIEWTSSILAKKKQPTNHWIARKPPQTLDFPEGEKKKNNPPKHMDYAN